MWLQKRVVVIGLLTLTVVFASLSSDAKPLKPTSNVLPPIEDMSPLTSEKPASSQLPPLSGNSSESLKGKVQTEQAITPPRHKAVLKGGVSTYDAIVEAEKGVVDWYAWYLACRRYIASHGGLQCDLGTPIHIYKNGRFDTPSMDPYCILSVRTKRFPLPRKTQLDMLILPVRSGSAPPASRDELRRRTKGWR